MVNSAYFVKSISSRAFSKFFKYLAGMLHTVDVHEVVQR